MNFKKFIKAAAAPEAHPYMGEDDLWRIDGVPICSTGIEYRLSTGLHTFTESELADAVKATTSGDVAINAPRIKLGHKSKANDLFLGEDEPAFGRIEGMTLSDNKQTIYGNFVGTPEWLAKVLPVAFPSRSVDAALGVDTATGKHYEMVITGVSLLGVRWPGCSTLEDLPMWYGKEMPADAEVDKVAASLDVAHIRKKFYNDGPGKDNYSWWIRGERFDTENGYNLIVDEGTGEISRISVDVDGSSVSFGDPIPVTEEYSDKAVAASAVLAGMRMADPAMVIHASRADTDRPDNSSQEGETMDEEMRLALAKRLGLPEDATEEQIKAELAKPVSETPPTPGTPPDGDDDDGDGDGDEEGKPEEEPTTTTGTVTLDRAAYEELKAGAALARSHEDDRVKGRVGEAIEAAVKDGRIPPARREHWSKMLTADFDGGKATLDSLEKGLVPLEARGSGGPGSEEGIQPGLSEGHPEDWFPEIKTIRAQAGANRPVVNAKEG